jgi:hypothetical protein
MVGAIHPEEARENHCPSRLAQGRETTSLVFGGIFLQAHFMT